ncbi:MAG: Flp family type IVb pilin [Syntrophobacteraceae bacterium]
MRSIINALWKDESGVTAIEYGLIAGLMAALLIGVLSGFNDKLSDLFSAINDKISSATDEIKSSGTESE